jgi:hypothetical protein
MPNTGFILWGSEHSTFWRTETTPQQLNNVGALIDSIAFVVGDSGLIMTNTDIIHGIGPVPEDSQLMVFPNPARDIVTLQTADTLLEVTLVDVVGKVVYTGGDTRQITVSHLLPGMYYVVARTSQGKEVVPLVIR